jgi:uncharacterized protein
MSDRQGVEINYCPECRGVWIDRGGLDKIIDRSGGYTPESRPDEGEREHHGRRREYDREGGLRKSFFSNLFD